MTEKAHFNCLSPDLAERLSMLAEECAEVIQAVTKIQRHGSGSWHPDTRVMNYDALRKEVHDVIAVVRAIAAIDAHDILPTPEECAEIWNRKLKFTHHQEQSDE